MPIKDFNHHYPRALFNDIPRVGAYFYDIPRVGAYFYDIPRVGAHCFRDIRDKISINQEIRHFYGVYILLSTAFAIINIMRDDLLLLIIYAFN